MAVATLDRTPEVLARRRGVCGFCDEAIVPGHHYIAKVDGKGWMHGVCAAEYRRLREIYEAEMEDADV